MRINFISILFIFLVIINNFQTDLLAQEIDFNSISKLVINADSSKLNNEQKKMFLSLLQKEFCYNGCSSKIITCLKNKNVSKTARRIAGFIIREILRGKNENEIHEDLQKRALSVRPLKIAKIDFNNVPHIGSEKATVKIVEYVDFECPYCKVISPIMKKLTQELTPNVLLYLKYFPVRGHKRALPAGLTGFAAWKQGKFWEMHDILYNNFKKHSDAELLEYAQKLKLNIDQYQRDINDEALKTMIANYKLEGLRNGVDGTPTVFINGKLYLSYKDYIELKDRIEEEIDIMAGRL